MSFSDLVKWNTLDDSCRRQAFSSSLDAPICRLDMVESENGKSNYILGGTSIGDLAVWDYS